MRCTAASCLLLSVAGYAGTTDYKPTSQQLTESYKRAETIRQEWTSKAFKLSLRPNWIDGGNRLWYRNDMPAGRNEFLLVDCATGAKSPAFDAKRLSEALTSQGVACQPDKLPFREIEYVDDGKALRFDIQDQGWKLDLGTYALIKVPAKARPRPEPPEPWVQNTWLADRKPIDSPDGKWTARIVENNVWVRPKSGPEVQVSHAGTAKNYFARIFWTPDSKRLVAVRVTPGDRNQVYLIQSSPQEWGPAKLLPRIYDRPGDKVDTFDTFILDVDAKKEIAVPSANIDYGDLPEPQWRTDNRHFTYEKMDRGYGRWRILEVDSETGATKAIVDDDPPTFVDSTAQYTHYVKGSDTIVWRSERDGWGHLYVTDADGKTTQITRGGWVVRGVEKVDDEKKYVIFTASGLDKTRDLYDIGYYRVDLAGGPIVNLTDAPGNHSAQFSPDGKTFVDTCSTIDTPPVHVLRSAETGKIISTLEAADVTELRKIGWKAPEKFVAKGRDGRTDIYGVVYRPSNFDPSKRYPVVEDIYAGPQDSYVPKSFAPFHWQQPLAELGFVVVQIDGMGTRNRGKAFHDVCYRNLADAGFPDRILWIKALAAKYPQIDANRVGIYGTSAGGQNSTGALLFHPEFYKVGVSSCGCHDNRLDKVWWNEQWMGYPVGPQYEASSNITHAASLKGKLLLMVGELDTNVPPESTYRLLDAFVKSNKDVDFLVLPGSDHTGGGTYGERKRRDFFVRNLLGVEPPNWNR